MADGRDLGFGPTGSSAIRSADLENPTPTKHEVDRMTCCQHMAVRNFPKCEVGRRSVGRSSVVNIYGTLISCTRLRYVRQTYTDNGLSLERRIISLMHSR